MARVRYRIVRSRRRHRVRWGRLLRTLALLALFVAGIELVRSPLLRLQQIRVVGGPASLADLTGLRRGTLIWEIDLPKASTEMLGRAPYLLTARIVRHFPQSVTIYISYRHPVAAVAGPHGGFYGVDETGRVLTALGGPGALPVLGGVRAAQIRPYHDLGPLAARAAQLAAGLTAARFPVSQVLAQGPLAVYLPSGTEVLWPQPSNLRQTLAELRAILRALTAQGAVAASIDLRLPSRPLVVYRR